jgi:hypothetical protein
MPSPIAISSAIASFIRHRKTNAANTTLPSTLTPSARSNALTSAAQCRSARALLGWSIARLAWAASVGEGAIDDFETERRAPVPAVVRRIRRAFEPAGILFLRGDDVACTWGAVQNRRRPRTPPEPDGIAGGHPNTPNLTWMVTKRRSLRGLRSTISPRPPCRVRRTRSIRCHG